MPELMALTSLPYHNISPNVFEIGGFALRWYSLAYIGGLFIGWWWMIRLVDRRDAPLSKAHVDDFLLWATLGTILGGRLGYVIFYKPAMYLDDPLAILSIWDGGMSFHGGLIGVVSGLLYFAHRNRIDQFRMGDYIACVAPIGLFFGRLANFINGELWGHVSTLPWAMQFPGGGDLPRHPSQVYEALLEGLVLFLITNYMLKKTRALDYPGMIAGTFFIGYGVARYLIEFVREPDAHLGYLGGFISMGQVLSLPMIAFGLWLVFRALKTHTGAGAAKSGNGKS